MIKCRGAKRRLSLMLPKSRCSLQLRRQRRPRSCWDFWQSLLSEATSVLLFCAAAKRFRLKRPLPPVGEVRFIIVFGNRKSFSMPHRRPFPTLITVRNATRQTVAPTVLLISARYATDDGRTNVSPGGAPLMMSGCASTISACSGQKHGVTATLFFVYHRCGAVPKNIANNTITRLQVYIGRSNPTSRGGAVIRGGGMLASPAVFPQRQRR